MSDRLLRRGYYIAVTVAAILVSILVLITIITVLLFLPEIYALLSRAPPH